MKKYYTVNELKTMVAGVHDNVSKLLSLVDYCESVVNGYKGFRKNKGLSDLDCSTFLEKFNAIRQDSNDLYDLMRDHILSLNICGEGEVGFINSKPISFVNKSIESELKNAENGVELMGLMRRVESVVNKMVATLIDDSQGLSEVVEICPTYLSDGVKTRINDALFVTKEALEGLGETAKYIKPIEEKYFEN